MRLHDQFAIGDTIEIVGGLGDEEVDVHIGKRYVITSLTSFIEVHSPVFQRGYLLLEAREVTKVNPTIEPLSNEEVQQVHSTLQRINQL